LPNHGGCSAGTSAAAIKATATQNVDFLSKPTDAGAFKAASSSTPGLAQAMPPNVEGRLALFVIALQGSPGRLLGGPMGSSTTPRAKDSRFARAGRQTRAGQTAGIRAPPSFRIWSEQFPVPVGIAATHGLARPPGIELRRRPGMQLDAEAGLKLNAPSGSHGRGVRFWERNGSGRTLSADLRRGLRDRSEVTDLGKRA